MAVIQLSPVQFDVGLRNFCELRGLEAPGTVRVRADDPRHVYVLMGEGIGKLGASRDPEGRARQLECSLYAVVRGAGIAAERVAHAALDRLAVTGEWYTCEVLEELVRSAKSVDVGPPEYQSTIGDRVRAARLEREWTIPRLQREMIRSFQGDIRTAKIPTVQWFRKLEESEDPPVVNRLRLLARALGWTLGELLGER